MEALKNWWSVLGKWQVLTIFAVLAVFFITRHITGDNRTAAFTAVVFAGFIAFVASLTVFAVAATAVAFAVASGTTFVTTLFVAAFLAAAVFVITEDLKIGKKTVYLSCAAEFVVILLPIFGTVQGWW
ncbi:hypothetical protein A2468_07980 [Candidatus Falkowbacteria bacterium RIFOXYC2_FULL_46_15]|nr:MAG: hypothetical protein A2468_07980 [Candidatus Falkowbacteria bacterium RIFOXYC2_FULL_46_15]